MRALEELKKEGSKTLAFAQAIKKLTDMHEQFLSSVKAVLKAVEENREQMRRISQLPKGEKGDKGDTGPRGPQGPSGGERGPRGEKGTDGKDGYTPVKGVDYFTESDKQSFISAILARIRMPRDGKDAVLDEDRIVKKLMEKMKDDKSFDWRSIPGLANEMASYRNQLAGKQYGKNTWARGSGTTVSAGTNVTLVPLSDGTVEINASATGASITTQYALTAVQAGDNVTIDLSQLTNFATFVEVVALYRNNMVQTEGASYNFTISGSTVTVFGADASEIFNITYSYS